MCVFAETTTSGTCGDNLIWSFNDGTFTISGTGKMYDYTASTRPWKDLKDEIASLVVDYGVTTIGASAFYECGGLKSISLPETLEAIGGWSFYKCYGLTNIYIPNNVSVIGYSAFYECNSLNFNLPTNLKIIQDGAFDGYGWGSNYVMTTLNFPYGTEYIGDAFSYWEKLTTVYIPSTVKYIGGFSGCETLKYITIGDGAMEIARYAFSDTAYYDDSTNWENGCLYIGKHLYRVKSDITQCNIKEGTLDIAMGAFDGCSDLTDVTLPDSLVRIGSNAFSWCENLNDVTLGKNIKTIGAQAFARCENLKSIVIPDNVTELGEGIFNSCTQLTDVSIGKGVNTISNTMFMNCSSITELHIPDAVTFIGDKAFYECSSLQSLTLPDAVTSIGSYAFYNCSSLKNVKLPKAITAIEECTFEGCNSLEKIDIPYSVTTIGKSAFQSCSLLKEVHLSKNITEIDAWAFYSCTALESIVIPPKVEIIYDYTFGGCPNIKTITIYNTLKEFQQYAFNSISTTTGDVYYFGSEQDKTNNIANYKGLTYRKWHYMEITPEQNSTFNLWDDNYIEFVLNFPMEIELNNFTATLKEYETDRIISEFNSDNIIFDEESPTKLIMTCIEPIPCGKKLYIDIPKGAVISKVPGVYHYGFEDKDDWSFTTSFGLTSQSERVSFLNTEKDFFADYSKAQSTYPIASSALKTKLENIIGKAELKSMLKKKKSFGGVCFGISTVTALYKAGLLDVTEFDRDAANLYTMDKPKDSTGANGVRDLINYYYMLQRVDEYKITGLDTLSANMLRKTSANRTKFKNTVKAIVEKALDMDNSKTPLILNYGRMNGLETFQHSVVLCSGRKNADNTYSLLVKDPNYQELKEINVCSDYCCVTDHNDNALVVLKTIDPTTIPSDWTIGQVKTASVDDYDILRVTAYGNFEIKNKEQNSINLDKGLITRETINILNESLSASTDGEYAEYVFYVESSDSYTFTSSDSRSGFTVISGNDYVSVDAENASAITINNGENVSVNGTDMSYQLFTTTADAENMLMVTGDSASSVSVALSVDGGAEINSDRAVSIESLYDDRIINPDSDGTTTLTKDADGKLTAESAFGWTADNIVITEDAFSCDITFEDGFTQNKAYATVAFYENVKLVQLSLKEIEVKSGEVAMDIQNLPYDSYKIFIWTDMNEMTPLEK